MAEKFEIGQMKVSIVTPSYNQGQFIERTLQSVASQTGVEIEHVIFDGGSTDETVEILKGFGHGIRWVSEKDKGQTDAVNKGIRATDGEIIGWLNSDDIYYPGAVARIVEYFARYPEIDVVYGMADHIDLDDQAFESYPTEPWDFDRLQETCFICQPALFFRRRVVEQHGLFDESLNYCMDYEYWLRLGKAGLRFAYLEEKLAGSRLYAENKTLRARVKVHGEINDMFKKLFGKVPDRWLFNYAHAVVARKTDRIRAPRWFMLSLLVTTLSAAWRWNGKISTGMMINLVQWGRAGFLRGVHEQ
jgi:glycosyltransferase involved in cell wall biosynthesis